MKLPRIAAVLVLLGCQASSLSPSGDAPPPACPNGAPGDTWCWVRGGPLVVDGDRELGTAFAIGADGAFLRWGAEAWVAAPVPARRTLTSGWVGSAANAWVSDDAGSAWHHDGSTWTEAPAQAPIKRLIGTPSGAVWAVTSAEATGHGGVTRAELLRRGDNQWVRAMEPFPYCQGGDYLIAQDGSPWSAGLLCDAQGLVSSIQVHRWDGSAWQPVGAPIAEPGWYPALRRTGAQISVSASRVFAWDGAAWLSYIPPERFYPQGLPVDVTAFWDGLRFSLAPRAIGCEGAFRLDDAHAFCFGSGRIFREQGALWSSTLPDPFERTLEAGRWGTVPPSLWAGGDTWRAWGSGPTSVFRLRMPSVSAGSIPERYDGTAWTPALDVRAVDVHGAGPDDVWFATEVGPVHHDGQRFVSLPIPVDLSAGPLTSVYALGGGTAVATTDDALLTFDGGWGLSYRAPVGRRIAAVAGSGPDDLWLVQVALNRSDEAELLHNGGGRWEQVPVASLTAFGGVSLATRGPDTWLSTEGAIVHVSAGGTPPPVAVDRLSIGATLWVGPDALWLTTDKVARRHALP